LLKELKLERVHLAAHDVGGGIAQILAVNHPEKFYDISLINSVAYNFWPVQPIIAMRTPIIRQLAMATLDVGALKLIVKRAFYHKEILNDNLMEKFAEQMKSKDSRKAFLHFARCLNNRDLTDISEDIKKIKIPVQIIRGEADVYLSKNISDELKRNIPNCKLHTIETAGHFAMLDEPVLISNLLLSFMKKSYDN
jgi:pimeloyl-ACP methyl ester carboxylesterase